MMNSNENKGDGKPHKGGRGKGGRGKDDRSRGPQKHPSGGTQSLSSDGAVPMLKYGPFSNYYIFNKKIALACMEKYKNLRRLINDEKYYVPPEINPMDYDLTHNVTDIEKGRLRDAHKRRDKEIDDIAIDRTSMFAYILSKISKDSQDELTRYMDYDKIEAERDPLKLWLPIKATHQTLSTSKVAGVVKKSAREEYSTCKQGAYESIVDYKRRFDASLDAYVASGNMAIPKEDIAMDFM
jgi:hypothetical protein